MFNFLLKRKLYIKLLLVCAATTTVTISYAANAANTANSAAYAASTAHDCCAYLDQAHQILKDVKKRGKHFFSKRKEPYRNYIRDLEIIIGRVRTIINTYPNSGSEKDRLMIELMDEINFVLEQVYNTLNKPYSDPLTLAKALQATANSHASDKKIQDLQAKVAILKTYLNTAEISRVDAMMDTALSLEKIVPASNFVCLSRISAKLKAR